MLFALEDLDCETKSKSKLYLYKLSGVLIVSEVDLLAGYSSGRYKRRGNGVVHGSVYRQQALL